MGSVWKMSTTGSTTDSALFEIAAYIPTNRLMSIDRNRAANILSHEAEVSSKIERIKTTFSIQTQSMLRKDFYI